MVILPLITEKRKREKEAEKKEIEAQKKKVPPAKPPDTRRVGTTPAQGGTKFGPVTPTDVAFATDPRTGETTFAGPGAAREREELGRRLTFQEQQRAADFARREAEERAPDIDAIVAEAIGRVRLTGDVEKDKLSFEQAFKSALSTAGVGAATGAAAGAITAGVPTAGAGAPIGAIVGGAIGAIGGLIAGMRSNLKTQRTDMVKGESQNLMKSEQNMLKQVMLMNQIPRLGGSTDDMVEIKTMFDEQMSLTDENNARLVMETRDDLSLWLGEDGHKQLEKYENFNSPGGMREILIKQMTLAMNSPDLGRLPGLQAQIQSIEGSIE